MLLKKPAFLGIELEPNRLRVVHGCVTEGRLEVKGFAQRDVPVGGSEGAASELEAMVARQGWRHSYVTLVVSGPEVLHRVLEFPPMPSKELVGIVEREMRAMGSAGGKELVFDWEILEATEDTPLKQVRVLVAVAPRDHLDHALRLIEKCRLKPGLIVTFPIALLRMLRFIEGGDSGLRAILYLGSQQGYLLGVKDGVWSVYREFSARRSGQGRESLEEEALTEANRVRAYYSQRYPEGGSPLFLLCGEKDLELFREKLESQIGTRVEVVRPGGQVELGPLKEKTETFLDIFPSLVAPLGLVAASYTNQGINLLPKVLRRPIWIRPSIDWSIFSRPALALAVLLVFLGTHLFLIRAETSYNKLRAKRSELYSQWQPAFRESEKSRDLRQWEKILRESVGSARIEMMPWVDFFKAISRLAPSSLVLHAMKLEGSEGRWKITLKGEVISSDLYGAQLAFNEFYQGLKSSPYVEDLELMPLKVSSFKERAEIASQGSSGTGDRRSSTDGKEEDTSAALITKTRVEFELKGNAIRA